MTEQRYAGGGIVRELLEGVAKEAPELSRGVRAATRRATINVGLDINGGEKLSPDEVLAALQGFGVKPVRAAVHQSDSEPTLVIELDRSLNAQEAHKLSMDLRQEAIAQVDENGVGDLHGPAADNWKPFNGDYFLDADGKRLSQAIMDAGEGEKPGYAGGGIIREAVEGLLEAAGRNADEAADLAKPMRLYHGTTKLPSDSKFGYWADIERDASKGFKYLSPDVRPSQLGLHLGTQKQADYFASGGDHIDDVDILLNKEHYANNAPSGGRIAPLDVDIRNPIRLEDRTGSWKPTDIYDQLVEQGKVEYDAKTWSVLSQMQDSDDEVLRGYATENIRRMIEEAGHDGVIYTNRVEGFVTEDPIRQRFKQRGIHDETALNDQEWLDVVPEARGNDSYIVWNKDQYKSPFGDGPGVGFAGGGIVKKIANAAAHVFDSFHGTGAKFELKDARLPLHFTRDRKVAEEFANNYDDPEEVRVISARLNFKNPFIASSAFVDRSLNPVDIKNLKGGEIDLQNLGPDGLKFLTQKGYDGVVFPDWDEQVVLSPSVFDWAADGGDKFAGGGVVRKLGQGLVDMLDFSGVGKPRTVKIPGVGEHAALPIAEIDDAAEAYMRKAGIPGTHRIDEYPELDPDFSRRIADQYDVLTHAPNDPEVARTYEALLEETMDQYRALKDTGLDIRFLKDGMDDPYALSPSMGYADMVNNGRLWVFPTSQGYGSGTDVLEHPLLKKVGKVGDLEDATANDAFRVVHDAYGHFGPGNPFFRAAGEDRAWMHHARMYSDDALPAMSAETRGQNSWVNFGPKARENKGASGASTIYADQKAVAMPRWVYEKDLGRIPKFADGGPVWSEEDIASMTHDHSYGTGREMNYLDTLGTQIPLGETNFYDVDGERRMPEGIQGLHDVGRLGIYAVPGAGPFIGAGLDTAEAIAEDDPLSAGMAVAFGPGGKLAKGAMTGTMAMGMDPAEAEAGLYGVLSKWGSSKEGQRMLGLAEEMEGQGADNGLIFKGTGWFKDIDGHWKFWLPSKGGGTIEPFRGSTLEAVYKDPFLFDQYPHMRDIGFSRMNDEGAYWDDGNERIVLGDTSKPGYNTPDAGGRYGALTHEIYHAKSSHEGWPQGTSTGAAAGRVKNDVQHIWKTAADPSVKALAHELNLRDDLGGLSFKRYKAEVGEAQARREAAMREIDYDNFGPYTPADQIYFDMPVESLFASGEGANIDKYKMLLQMLDDERVAADMQKAAAAKPKPKPKGRR